VTHRSKRTTDSHYYYLRAHYSISSVMHLSRSVLYLTSSTALRIASAISLVYSSLRYRLAPSNRAYRHSRPINSMRIRRRSSDDSSFRFFYFRSKSVHYLPHSLCRCCVHMSNVSVRINAFRWLSVTTTTTLVVLDDPISRCACNSYAVCTAHLCIWHANIQETTTIGQ
jgi:hypothetical protein